jgi:cytochrome c oxidase subunit IV
MSGHVLPVKSYVIIWALLMFLLVATVGLDYLALGTLNIVAAMGIAIIKATLVVLFFMHVRYSSPLIWLAAAGGFYWLGILILLSMVDYATRGWLPVPGK